MKKIALATIAMFISTVAMAQNRTMNVKDSAAYAIGMDFSRMLMNFDTTLNVDVVVQGLRDNLAGRARFSSYVAQDAIQNLVQLNQVQQQELALAEIEKKAAWATQYMDSIAKLEGVSATPSGLLYKIEQMGGAKLPQQGDKVTVHYTLMLPDGKQLDSSYDRGEPMTYANEQGQMIVGFAEGVQLLGEGGKATLYLPPSLGYGSIGAGSIGPHQVLIFQVSLLAITPVDKQKKERR